MSYREPAKFQLFFGSGEEDGSAYYSKNLAVYYWPSIEPVKYKLASAIGMLDTGWNLEVLAMI